MQPLAWPEGVLSKNRVRFLVQQSQAQISAILHDVEKGDFQAVVQDFKRVAKWMAKATEEMGAGVEPGPLGARVDGAPALPEAAGG